MFPDLSEPAVKLIAFYLPQFHPIPENDRWWGKGFTEWSNVSKARPLFPGHYQPHLPGELGFYDLRLVEVIQRQIKLAKQYGLYGFCLYLYWFQGKRLLERPVEQFLAHPELDFPFCLCWANENWTRRWDGQDNEVLIGQEYSPDDDLAFIRDIEPYLRDPRYIRIDGKPLLLVYNPGRLPDAQGTVSRWREYCHSTGIGDLFLVMAQTFGIIDPRPFGFDAAVEFPPHNTHMASRACDITHTIRFFEPGFTGGVYDYADIVRGYPLEPTEYLLFKGVMLGWDNTARRDRRASIFVNSSPKVFQKWLENVMQWTLQHQMPTQRLVFINAWNEWAEGTHLEPDRQYGYAYLNATARALQRVAVKVCIPQKHTVWIENSSKHSRLPEKIRTLDDKAWLNLLLKSVLLNYNRHLLVL
jgi:lipopolysaccharide biosynthesis protein